MIPGTATTAAHGGINARTLERAFRYFHFQGFVDGTRLIEIVGVIDGYIQDSDLPACSGVSMESIVKYPPGSIEPTKAGPFSTVPASLVTLIFPRTAARLPNVDHLQ